MDEYDLYRYKYVQRMPAGAVAAPLGLSSTEAGSPIGKPSVALGCPWVPLGAHGCPSWLTGHRQQEPGAASASWLPGVARDEVTVQLHVLVTSNSPCRGRSINLPGFSVPICSPEFSDPLAIRHISQSDPICQRDTSI